MKRVILLMVISGISGIAMAQNVGIGTSTPTDGKLHVVQSGTSTLGMFSDGVSGVALISEFSRPAIGLNMYYTGGGYKFKGAGFGGLFYYSPSAGSMVYYSSTISGVAGGAVAFTDILTLRADGNVGIGTSSPSEGKLQIHEPAGNTQFIAAAGSNLPGISTFVPISSPSIGYNVRYQTGYKFMGAGYGSFWQYSPSLGRLQYYYSSTSGAADGNLTPSFALAIDSSGFLGIGTSIPKAPLHVTGNVVFGSSSIIPAVGYKVSVDGKIICEELKVQLSTAWPDYVFEKDYPLPSLEQLKELVMREKHLPGMLPAATIDAQQGYMVGDMQKRFLEKLEELYRYMFIMNDENKQLRTELLSLKKIVGQQSANQ